MNKKHKAKYRFEETIGLVSFFIVTGYLILKVFFTNEPVQWGIVYYGCTVSILCFLSGVENNTDTKCELDGPHMHMPASKGTYLVWSRTAMDQYEYRLITFDPEGDLPWSDVIQWWAVPKTRLNSVEALGNREI